MVGSKVVVVAVAVAVAVAELVSHWYTDVEVLGQVEGAGRWAPVERVEGTAMLQARHELDRGAGLVLLDTAVGTWVVLSVSDLVLDMVAALAPLVLEEGSAGVVEAQLFGQEQDTAEKWPQAGQEVTTVVVTLVLTL